MTDELRVESNMELAQREVRTLMRDLRAVARNGHQPVAYTRAQHQTIAAMFSYILAVNDRLAARIKSLEDKSVRYEGTWKSDIGYGVNALITDKGSTWISTRITNVGERPGTNDGWKLAAKSRELAR
jgi:hypothetical protein